MWIESLPLAATSNTKAYLIDHSVFPSPPILFPTHDTSSDNMDCKLDCGATDTFHSRWSGGRSTHVWNRRCPQQAPSFQPCTHVLCIKQALVLELVRHWRWMFRLPKDKLLIFQLHAKQPVQEAWKLELDVGVHAHDSAAMRCNTSQSCREVWINYGSKLINKMPSAASCQEHVELWMSRVTCRIPLVCWHELRNQGQRWAHLVSCNRAAATATERLKVEWHAHLC